MKADTTEGGLEALIVADMTGTRGVQPVADAVRDSAGALGSLRHWQIGDPKDYDRAWTLDLVQFTEFVRSTQPKLVGALSLDEDTPIRQKFLGRLQGEITKRGVIDVLRKGVKHGPHDVALFYASPSAGNTAAQARFRLNRFTVTRQLRYSLDDTAHALDFGLFINGLPVATFELKNSLTKQTVADAVEQYRRDRDPREKLFEFGRCIAHFAVDDAQVMFCTHLKGKASWFLPFNRGWNDGAGNPPNPDGLKTDYLWKEVLAPASFANIIENFAQIIEKRDLKTGKIKKEQVFPRFHQLDVVRALLADARKHGAGRRVLIQHSAGSGKSNSIAWLAHQLVGLEVTGQPVFNSVIVVTDRRILDQQIRDTIKHFAKSARQSAMRNVAVISGRSLPQARRSSSPRSRNSRSFSMTSAPTTKIAGSPS